MIALEHIAPEDWGAVERVRLALQSLVVDTGGLSVGVRFGSSSMTWVASTDSGPKTITHGLGRAPVLATAFNADTTGSFAGIGAFTVAAVGATTFDVYGRLPAAASITKAIYWLVIG